MTFDITYTAAKSGRGGFAPFVTVNGNCLYLNEANRKTLQGALNVAKRHAEARADIFKRMSKTNTVSVRQA